MGKIPDNFIIYPYVPQLEVLQKTDVFITHGGMNSITEALYFGVPMIVIPHMADQTTNASRVERLNLGKLLNRRHITPALLRETALLVMNDTDIRKSIASMKEKMHSVKGNKSGADAITQYYRKINSTHYEQNSVEISIN